MWPYGPGNPDQPVTVLVVGAGQRGKAYAAAFQKDKLASRVRVAAVAEPDDKKRRRFAERYNIPAQNVFGDWRDVVSCAKQGRRLPVDGVLICTLDWQHAEAAIAMAQLNYHLMLEKPLSTTWKSTLEILQAVRKSGRLFATGHVLRYSPFNILLKRLISEEKVIGKIVNVHHTERVGWWHFAHSYVRGNWRNSGIDENGQENGLGAPSLLAKCCHDVDLLFWWLSEEAKPTETQHAVSGTAPEPSVTTVCNEGLNVHGAGGPITAGEIFDTSDTPSTVFSVGSRPIFRRSNKPADAGTHCLACAIEEHCLYSAKRIYITHALKNPSRGTNHPVSVLVPDIEDYPASQREDIVLSALAPSGNNYYGRCVWDIPDNDVCENQVVTFTFPGGVIATLAMIPTTGAISKRMTTIYGTHGEIQADEETKKIVVRTFADDTRREYQPQPGGPGTQEDSHGGGDFGLAKAFADAIWMVEREGRSVEDAQLAALGASVDDVETSHRGVWVAERSRTLGKVLDWDAEIL